MIYSFRKLVYSLKDYDSHSDYEFYDNSNVEDSSNDYNRILKAIDNGAFIISACRSAFEEDKINAIKNQLDHFNVPYTQEELNKLEETNCDRNSGIYKHLLARYNSKNTKDLENDLRAMGYGFRASYGGYQETINSFVSKEQSFFVPYIESKSVEEFENDLAKLIDKYIQDSGLIVHPKLNTGKPYYMKSNKSIDFAFGKKYPEFTKPEDEYFTETKKSNSKPFTFKDSVLTKEEIARELANTKMLITRPSSHLRSIYNNGGWSKN